MNKMFFAFLGLTIIIACNSNHKQSNINLNNGKKWEVNSEMKPHIEKGNELLDEFVSRNKKDFHKLAENLRTQNNALIQSCTMKGESHDELHKWLHPHMELIEKLANAANSEEAEIVISKIDKSYEIYQDYFQ